MAQCPNCGAGLRPGFPRCTKCGSMVDQSPPAAPSDRASSPESGERSDHGNVNVNVHIDPSHLPGAGDSSHGWSDHPDVPGPPTAQPAYLKPHRAGAIMAWAIIGWFFCVIIGPLIAISMANSDLKAMKAGTMDPSGRGSIGAAKIIAVIALVMQLLGLGLTMMAAAAEGGL